MQRALCTTLIALSLAARFGLNHEIVHTAELERPEYRANPANRCYYCKHELYTRLAGIARCRRPRSRAEPPCGFDQRLLTHQDIVQAHVFFEAVKAGSTRPEDDRGNPEFLHRQVQA